MATTCNEGRISSIGVEVAEGAANARPLLRKLSACWAFACAVFLALSVSVSIGMADDQDSADPEVHATGFVPVARAVYEAAPETPVFRAFLPYSVDLAKSFPRPGNQGELGSCVAWAVGYAARAYYSAVSEHLPIGLAQSIPSPAYIYDSVRTDEDCSGGSTIASALDLLENGSLSLADAPYSDKRCRRPTAAQIENANSFRIRGWKRIDYGNLDQLKAELANGNPVVFGVRQTPISFHRLSGSKTYRWNGVSKDAKGAHALTMVGYDDKRQAFRIINSWGRRWGDHGFAWVAYDTISMLIDEAYVMDVAERPIPVPQPRPEPLPTPDLNIPALSCSHLSSDGNGSHPVISGFVGYRADLEKVEKAVEAANGVSKVELRPWPQCEALLTLSEFLGKTDAPAVQVAQGKEAVNSGDALTVSVTTPPHPTYLYLSYIQADGSVVNLLQPQGPTPSPLAARSAFMFGDGKDGKARFTVGPPFGQEMVIAIAAKSPLFPAPLPRQQTEREYLSAVRAALYATPIGSDGPRVAAGTIATVETREKTE